MSNVHFVAAKIILEWKNKLLKSENKITKKLLEFWEEKILENGLN
jgi:hypothetical protein